LQTHVRRAILVLPPREGAPDERHHSSSLGYDVEGIVVELDQLDADTDLITPNEFYGVAARHEYDKNGTTDAALAKALERSQTGWIATIRRPDGEIQMLPLNMTREDDTAETVEARLREFVNFPEGTSMMILPLVG
jgi:hypothetical protein